MSTPDTDPTVAPTTQEYASGSLRGKLDFEDRTLTEILRIQSALGEKPLAQTGNKTLSYGDAPDIAALYAGKLASVGVLPGARVLTFMSSCIEQVQLWFGASWAGAIMVPVNTAIRGEQLIHAIKTAAPTVIVADEKSLMHLLTVAEAVAEVDCVLVVGDESPASHDSIGSVPVKSFTLDAEPLPPHAAMPSDVVAILYTSGTTGPSKGVLCPHAQFYWWGDLTGASLDIEHDDVLYTALPLFHTNALNTLWQSLLQGATYTFSPQFSASRFWQEAMQHGATVTYLLGSMAGILLKQPPANTDGSHGIRAALCPATPLEMVEAFQDRFAIKLIEGYGSTETNLVFSNVIGGHFPASMGRVSEGFEVRIVDSNDCDVEDGQPGELIIRNREPFSMASGYFGNPAATVKAWRNLWFHTGDRVYRDPETKVYYFVDRLVDAIRRRGENVSSWEVENAILAHSCIEAAAVFGVPSDLGSEEDIMTHVVLKPHQAAEPEEIIRFLETRLAYFAIPRYWEFVHELPYTENGKVKKHVLRAQGVTKSSWDMNAAGVVINRNA